jgi:hypothetical protein
LWSKPVSAYYASASVSSELFNSVVRQLEVICESRSGSATESLAAAVRAALVLAYELEEGHFSREAAKQLMKFVESNARNRAWPATNKLLFDLDVEKLSSRSLTGVVRATARMQDVLPAWKQAYVRVWNAVEQKGKDPRSMFVGMGAPKSERVGASSK